MFVHPVCHSAPVPALPVPRGAGFFPSIAWDNGAGKPGQGVLGRGTGREAEKVGPGQRWERDLSGLLKACGDGGLLIWTEHLWEATEHGGRERLPPGSSGGSHHFHCTTPREAEAVDDAHSGGCVLHFLEGWFISLTSSHWLFLDTFSLFSIPLFSPTALPAAARGVHSDVVVPSDLPSYHGGELKLLCSPFPPVGSGVLPARPGCQTLAPSALWRRSWAEEPYKSTWPSLIPDPGSLYRAGRAIPVPCTGRWTEFQSSLQYFIMVTSACHIRVQ